MGFSESDLQGSTKDQHGFWDSGLGLSQGLVGTEGVSYCRC